MNTLIIGGFTCFIGGAILMGFLISQYSSQYLPSESFGHIKEQCDQSKIATMRQYICPSTITAVLHYKDGKLSKVEWEPAKK